MSTLFSRRRMMTGLSALSGSLLAGCTEEQFLPPQFRSVFDVSDALTFAAQRLLTMRQPLAPEYTRADISRNFPAINTVDPKDEGYQELKKANFAEWRLPVEGLVDRPQSLSLVDLKALPARTQITAHSCERGWTAIAQWTGVPLARVLEAVGLQPTARYIVFYAYDRWYESLDLFDAFHPQTLLAYGMNDGDLPIQHGAPIRLRAERHLGYKNLKFVKRIEAVASMDAIGKGRGSLLADLGFGWNAGI